MSWVLIIAGTLAIQTFVGSIEGKSQCEQTKALHSAMVPEVAPDLRCVFQLDI